MLQSNGKSILAIDGIDQQDFDKIQLVSGAFPFQVGLQQRFPGKRLDRVFPSSVGSIFPFYNVYGRPYTIFDLNGSMEIIETPIPTITLPAVAPTSNAWFDDFSGYTVDAIQRLWGAGIWQGGVGVCETIIEGVIDPFLVYATIAAGTASINNAPQTVSSDGATATGEDTGTNYQFPKDPPAISLKVTRWTADNSCTGQGTDPTANVVDSIKLYNQPGDFTGTTIDANGLTVGQKLNWFNLSIGRIPDEVFGLRGGTCNPSGNPTPIVYFYNLNNGEYGQES